MDPTVLIGKTILGWQGFEGDGFLLLRAADLSVKVDAQGSIVSVSGDVETFLSTEITSAQIIGHELHLGSAAGAMAVLFEDVPTLSEWAA